MNVCALCSYSALMPHQLERHILAVHRSHPKFTVRCAICNKTWQNYDSYRKHVLRKHKLQVDCSITEQPVAADDSSVHMVDVQVNEEHEVDHALLMYQYEKAADVQAACFVSRLKSEHGLSQRAIQDVILNTTALIKTCLDASRENVMNHLSMIDESLSRNAVETLLKQQIPVDPFAQVSTPSRLLKYLRENCSLVEPVAVKMGERFSVNSRTKKTIKTVARGYLVPFMDNLRGLISMPEVTKLLFSHDSSTADTAGCLFDFEDGQFCKNDPVFRGNSLRILGYYDDIEVVNPIGVHTKKNKLSVFFWTLLNIPPKLRSKLSCIQLIAVAKAADCRRFGLSVLLHDFIEGLRDLYTTGIEISDGSSNLAHLKGGLVAFAGDTPAANLIGGFKEGVGFANKLCRTCEITKSGISNCLYDSQCIRRNEKDHKKHCDELETFMTEESRRYWSMTYGINSRSVLLDLPGFEVTRCLIHDPMHLLLEGVLMSEVKRLLKYLISKKRFNISYVNSAVASISAIVPANCRPNAIDEGRLSTADDRLNQTANQMMWFALMLPSAVHSKILPEDEDRWLNFIRLVMVLQLCLSPVCTAATVHSLQILIAKHNELFTSLYEGQSFTPKMHFLIHLPTQMQDFGPLRNQWCMRMEAKNSFFKRKKLRNTKNIPKSVATEHQIWMCCAQHDNAGNKNLAYLNAPIINSAGKLVHIADYSYAYLLQLPEFSSPSVTVLNVTETNVNGIAYSVGNFIVSSDKSQSTGLEFSCIRDIVLDHNEVYFICTKCYIDCFETVMNAYCVRNTQCCALVLPEKLHIPWPVLHVCGNDDNTYFLTPMCISDIEILP